MEYIPIYGVDIAVLALCLQQPLQSISLFEIYVSLEIKEQNNIFYSHNLGILHLCSSTFLDLRFQFLVICTSTVLE